MKKLDSNKLKYFNQIILMATLFALATACQREELNNIELENEFKVSVVEDLGCPCLENQEGELVEVNGSKYVKCPNGLYFEGDMAFTEEQIKNKSISSRGYFQNFKLWDNGIIYLKNFESSGTTQGEKVYKAIKNLEEESNLIVVPINENNSLDVGNNFLQINAYTGRNWAQYGANSPSRMDLTTDVRLPIVKHEFGHIAGLLHEHTRSDRDDYLIYNKHNVKAGQASNFNIGNGVTHGPFDFSSMMLYGSRQFSVTPLNDNNPTLTKKNGGLLYWNSGFSQGDFNAINAYYPSTKREAKRHSMDGAAKDWHYSEATVFRPESNAFIVGVGVSAAGDNVTTLKVKYANINSAGETTATWFEKAGSSASSTPETWVEVPQGYVITGLGAGILNDNVRTLRAYARSVEHFEDGGNNNTSIRLSNEETIYNVGSQPNSYLETEVKFDSRTKTLQGIGLRSFNDHMFNSKGYFYDHDLSSGNENGTTQPVNLALNAIDCLQNSSYNNDYNCQMAFDGDLTTKWVSDGTSIQSSIVVDLGAVKDISKIVVKHAGANGEPIESNTEQFKIEYGSSNIWGPWTEAGFIDNNGQANESEFNFDFTARYVHLYIIDPGVDNYSRIPEIEIWGN